MVIPDHASTGQSHRLLRWQWPIPPIPPGQFDETLFDVEIEVAGGLQGAYPMQGSPQMREEIRQKVILLWAQAMILSVR